MPQVTTINKQNRAEYGFRITPPVRRVTELPASQPCESSKRNIRTIQATAQEKVKLKVAAYCRVSTMMACQETSVESQETHYRDLITSNPEWELAGIYIEVGVSSTHAEARPELQRLIRDCKAGRVDLILTKSISRFARNTSDCLDMVRTLTALGVNIRFEKEGIRTDSMESEFMLSILACLAEDESRSISKNVKWGIQKRFESGTYRQSQIPYGYRRDEAGKIIICDDEDVIVREIFKRSADGEGAYSIADGLNERGIPSRAGGMWQQSTIRYMLQNPFYIGDCVYQKFYTDENFNQRRNDGVVDQYLDQNHHPAIIDRATFDLANQDRSEGAHIRYPLSGKVICACCGSPMYRQMQKDKIIYVCEGKRRKRTTCENKPVPEDVITQEVLRAFEQLSDSSTLDNYIDSIAEAEKQKHTDEIMAVCTQYRANKIELDTLAAVAMVDYFREDRWKRQIELMHEQEMLEKELQSLQSHATQTAEAERLRLFLRTWDGMFPEEDFRDLVESITIKAGAPGIIKFKCGLQIPQYMSVNAPGNTGDISLPESEVS